MGEVKYSFAFPRSALIEIRKASNKVAIEKENRPTSVQTLFNEDK
jgi:hypothetical protein